MTLLCRQMRKQKGASNNEIVIRFQKSQGEDLMMFQNY